MAAGDERSVLQGNGVRVEVDHALGHLAVEHDGTITWEQLQEIKTIVWGADARAIEVYPMDRDVLNKGNIRHLWRLGDSDFAPDLLGRKTHTPMMQPDDSLQVRWAAVWAGNIT